MPQRGAVRARGAGAAGAEQDQWRGLRGTRCVGVSYEGTWLVPGPLKACSARTGDPVGVQGRARTVRFLQGDEGVCKCRRLFCDGLRGTPKVYQRVVRGRDAVCGVVSGRSEW